MADDDFYKSFGVSKDDVKKVDIDDWIEEVPLNEIADYIQQGDAAFESGEYQSALDLYNKAVKLGSGEARKKAKQAKVELVKVIVNSSSKIILNEMDPQSLIADYIRDGDAYFKDKDYRSAIDLYNKAVKLGSGEARQKAEKAKEELLKMIADVIKQADDAFESKDYSKAVKLYNQATDLGSMDVQQKLEQASEKMWEENCKRVERILNETGAFKVAGKDTVFFGVYPQSLKDDDIEIGDLMDKELNYYLGSDNCLYEKLDDVCYYKVEPIKWKVLSRGLPFARKYFVVADQILDAYQFDDDSNNYENSEIRSWLNNNFCNKAFTNEQKSKILTTMVDNSLESTGDSYNNYTCNNTSDKIFLLSHKEAEQYFTDSSSRQKMSTHYTHYAHYLSVNCNGYSDWWLRSPFFYQNNFAQAVHDLGVFHHSTVDYYCGVLPALKFKP